MVILKNKYLNWFILASLPVIAFSYSFNTKAYDRGLFLPHLIWAISVVVMSVIYFADYRDTDNFQILKSPFFALSGLYFICSVAAGFFAANIGEWIYECLRIILMTVYIFILYQTINKEALIKMLCLIGGAFCIYGIVEYFVWYSSGTGGETANECVGLMSNRNLWASMFLIILPFSVYGTRYKSLFWRSLCIFNSIAIIALLAFLFCRSAFLGLIVSALSVCIFFKRKLLFVVIPLVVLALAFAWFIKNGSSTDTYSIWQRSQVWKQSIIMLKDFPFGVGGGNWQIFIQRYLSNVPIKNLCVNLYFRQPHNDFVWTISEAGIIGGFAYVGLFIYALAKCIKTKNILVFAGLVAYMVVAFFDFPKERPFHQVILCIYFALALGEMSIKDKLGINPNQQLKNIIGYVTVSILLFTTLCFWQRYNTDVFTRQIKQTSDDWQNIIVQTDKFSEFATIDGTSIPIQWYRGVAFFKLGSIGLAKDSFMKAYEANPYNINVLNNIAACYSAIGDNGTASQYLARALQIRPDAEEVQNNFAAIVSETRK